MKRRLPVQYYCITHKPIAWKAPEYVEVVSVEPGADTFASDLGSSYPELRGKNRTLGEYATLFALRRRLQESSADEQAPMTGLCHYRRFAVVRPASGTVNDLYVEMSTTQFTGDIDSYLIPPAGAAIIPAPVSLGRSVLSQYAAFHHAQDLLRLMSIAVDLGVVDGPSAAEYLSQPNFVPVPTVGLYPTPWLIDMLVKLEAVATAFEVGFEGRKDYQERATGFSCERLHSLLVFLWLNTWPHDRVAAHRMVLLTS